MADGIVRIAHVDTHDQRRLVLAGDILQKVGLAIIHLDGIRACRHQCTDNTSHVLKTVQEGRLIAHAVINRHVEAASRAEQAVHPDLKIVAHIVLLVHCVR